MQINWKCTILWLIDEHERFRSYDLTGSYQIIFLTSKMELEDTKIYDVASAVYQL